MAGEAGTADRLQGQRFAGQNLRLCFDVIVRVHHVIERVSALERKNVGIFAVDFNTSGRGIHRLHAERGDRNDGNHRKQERKNQPLMLAQNEKVVVKMRLAGRKIKWHEARLGSDDLNRSVGTVFSWNEFVFVSHSSSITLRDAKYRNRG